MTTTNESREALEPVAWMDEEHGWVTLDHLRACKWKVTVGVKVEPLVRAKDAAAQLATVETRVRELEANDLEAKGQIEFLDRENDRLRSALAAANTAYEQVRQDCLNLTEKVIQNLRNDLAAAKSGGEWQLVPDEPTEAMIREGWAVTHEAFMDRDKADPRHVYIRMLAAAPKKED